MTTGERFFLVLAEELNFHRAAEKCFISQQALSEHIRKLEEEYKVQLFIRKPHVILTREGQFLYRTLLEIDRIERGLRSELSAMDYGKGAHIRIGMNYTRANIVMADILSEFWRRYPEISVEIIVDETVAMKERLLKRELDCFLGVNTIHDSTIRFIPVVNESVYLVATEDCLQSHLNIGTSAAAQHIRDNRFDAFNRLPLILHYSISTAHSLILNHIRALGWDSEPILNSSDYHITSILCSRGLAACFFPDFFVPVLFNKPGFDRDKLLAEPIKGLSESLRVEMILPHLTYIPQYLLDFCDIVKSVYHNYRN